MNDDLGEPLDLPSVGVSRVSASHTPFNTTTGVVMDPIAA
jgi:hypothetical protein